MKQQLGKRFWTSLIIFGLMGQVAWVVENMYLNVFIYKMFHASAGDISLMVGASSAVATVTTILVGAYTDYIGRRKVLICGGYIAWGISILAFALLRMELLTPIAGSAAGAAALGITLVILFDCVMTFFGSSANDAAFNAWMTDWGDESSRGRIEGINSMMPLVSILVVFGGFSVFDLELADSWSIIYLIIGIAVLAIGLAGIAFIQEKGPNAKADRPDYVETLIYSFRPSVIQQNQLLYAVIGAFAVFGISIQIFMPYLILYYEKTLGMEHYVLIMAPAIVIAAVITACYGRLFDLMGFRASILPTIGCLIVGYLLLYRETHLAAVFVGSLLMMTGYLTGMAVFGAMIRTHIPAQRAGQFQGIRIIGQVLVPGIVGPALGAYVLRHAKQIVNSDGTTSFLPNRNIFLAALFAALLLLGILHAIFQMIRDGHHKLTSEAGEALLEKLIPVWAKSRALARFYFLGFAGHEEGASDVWNEHPLPQLRRDSFYSLNGQWTLEHNPISIPFPPQALLSGFQEKIGTRLHYQRMFSLDEETKKALNKGCKYTSGRLLLHFGAVDQIASVYLNGTFLGTHKGGYLPFAFDITDHVNEDNYNMILVYVKDTLSHRYPYGKQKKAHGGMWYTPVSGIWQSVWLERVPSHYIDNLEITADLSKVRITADLNDDSRGYGMSVSIKLHNGIIHTVESKELTAEIDLSQIRLSDGSRYQPLHWDTKHPYLYDVTVTVGEDTVSSYFGLRTIEVKEVHGIPRVCLNGNPIFLHGVLDQGYFCDGIFLPAKESEYEQDILRMKELGFNLLRKHIKLEPEAFYYYCDRHGMLVMQDMVNNGAYSWLRHTALPTLGIYPKRTWSLKPRENFFLMHMAHTIQHLKNHPCIIAYTIFNEGWGQFRSDDLYDLARQLDDSRLYDTASGWFPCKNSDFDSQHIYFKELNVPKDSQKPVLVSECGGYSLPVPDHLYSKYTQFGYGTCENPNDLTKRIVALYEGTILPGIKEGVCGCIYTQLSDVEDETNGLYTYDRKVCKVDRAAMQALTEKLADAMGSGDTPP